MEIVDHLADRATVEKHLGQSHQVVQDGGFRGLVNAVGCVGEDVAAQGFQDPSQHRRQQQHQGDADQGIEVVLMHHLVDQLLQAQGCHQGQQVDHDREGQHLHQGAAVFLQEGPIPAPAEALLLGVLFALQQQQGHEARSAVPQLGGCHPQGPQFRLQQPQAAIGVHPLQQSEMALLLQQHR